MPVSPRARPAARWAASWDGSATTRWSRRWAATASSSKNLTASAARSSALSRAANPRWSTCAPTPRRRRPPTWALRATNSAFAGAAGDLQDRPGTRQMRHVDHLAAKRERHPSGLAVFLEGREQLLGVSYLLRRGRKYLVDDFDLARMDRDLAGKAHPCALDTIAAASVGIFDVNEDGVDRLDPGRGGREQRHDTRVAKDFEEFAALVAIAPRADRRRKVLGAP